MAARQGGQLEVDSYAVRGATIVTDPNQGSAVFPPCPLCGNRSYRQERGKIDSEWGITAHRVVILICEQCGHILLFDEGRTMWDFD